jgi:hypothetical protein
MRAELATRCSGNERSASPERCVDWCAGFPSNGVEPRPGGEPGSRRQSRHQEQSGRIS